MIWYDMIWYNMCMHADIPIRANEWMHMGATSSSGLKVWEVGSNKFRHFQSPFVWGTSWPRASFVMDRCNGQRRWQILEGPGQMGTSRRQRRHRALEIPPLGNWAIGIGTWFQHGAFSAFSRIHNKCLIATNYLETLELFSQLCWGDSERIPN